MAKDKEEVLAWFHQVDPVTRVDFICKVLQLCNPFEIRLIGTCVEHLARKDYHRLRDSELKANDLGELKTVTDKVLLGGYTGISQLIIYLSLMHARPNSLCPKLIYDLTTALDQWMSTEDRTLNDSLFCDIKLLLTIAIHHPAFTWSQKDAFLTQLKHIVQVHSRLKQMTTQNKDEDHEFCSTSTQAHTDNHQSEFTHHTHLLLRQDQDCCDIQSISLLNSESDLNETSYVIKVTTNMDHEIFVKRTYNEIKLFHHSLLQLFPDGTGAPKHLPKIPLMKGETAADMLEYLNGISKMPDSYLNNKAVREFFLSSPTDDRGYEECVERQPGSGPQRGNVTLPLVNMDQSKPPLPSTQASSKSAVAAPLPQSSSEVIFSTQMSHGSKQTAKPTDSCNSMASPAVSAASSLLSSNTSTIHQHKRTYHPTQQFYSAQSARLHSRTQSPVPTAPLQTPPSSSHAASMPKSIHSSQSMDTLSSPVQQFLKGLKLHKYEGLLTGYSLVELSKKTSEEFQQMGLAVGASKKLVAELDKARLKRSLVMARSSQGTEPGSPMANLSTMDQATTAINTSVTDPNACIIQANPHPSVNTRTPKTADFSLSSSQALMTSKNQRQNSATLSKSTELHKKQTENSRIQRSWSSSNIPTSTLLDTTVRLLSPTALERPLGNPVAASNNHTTDTSVTMKSLQNNIEIEVLQQTPDDLAIMPATSVASQTVDIKTSPQQNKKKPSDSASSVVTHSDLSELSTQPPSAVYVSVRNHLKTAASAATGNQTAPQIADSSLHSPVMPVFKSPVSGPTGTQGGASIYKPLKEQNIVNQNKANRVRQNSSSMPTVEDIQMMQREKKQQKSQLLSTSLPNRTQTVTRQQLPNTAQTHQSIQTGYSNQPIRTDSGSIEVDIGDSMTDDQTDNDISDIQQERAISLPLSVNMDHTKPLVEMPASFDQLSERLEECDINNSSGSIMTPFPQQIVTNRLHSSVPVTVVHSVAQPPLAAVPQTTLLAPHGSAPQLHQHHHHHQPPPLQVNSDSEGSYIGQPNGYKFYPDMDMYSSIPGDGGYLTPYCMCAHCSQQGMMPFPMAPGVVPSHPSNFQSNGFIYQGFPIPTSKQGGNVQPHANGLTHREYIYHPISYSLAQFGTPGYNGHMTMPVPAYQPYYMGMPFQKKQCSNCGGELHDRTECPEPVDMTASMNQYKLDMVPPMEMTD